MEYLLYLKLKGEIKMNINFKLMSEEETKNIVGGFAITALISTILSVVTSTVGIVGTSIGLAKTLNANKGEVKAGNISMKWDNSNENIGYAVGMHYCI
ncbi:hypothetical protein IEN87_02430 [Mycoplasma hominis]|nr:hypothetical protein [Metamycoplasma hominis]